MNYPHQKGQQSFFSPWGQITEKERNLAKVWIPVVKKTLKDGRNG